MKQLILFLCFCNLIKAAHDEAFNKNIGLYSEDKTFSLSDLSNWKNEVKWSSMIHAIDHPEFALVPNDTVPLVTRLSRRKRCTCGCSGCDLFPNRACCGSDCCSSEPTPLACCPPPPPPKPCCQPNFGPCCPATPNCCKKPCCRGQRPDIYEEEDFGSPPPVVPAADRTCCPPLTPAQPPPPPVPPPPPPEPPVECCAPPQQKKTPCGCQNCGCGRPCCYYRDAECCRTKPCCPPELPCCPPLPTLPVCCNMAPPCLRACPTCPCRKRIHLGKRAKRQGFEGLHCQQCLAPGATSNPSSATAPRQNAAKTVAVSTTGNPLLVHTESRDFVEEAPRAGKLFENSRHIRVKRAGCQVCVDGRPLKREKRHACVQCTYLHPVYGNTPNGSPYGDNNRIQTPVPIPLLEHMREKRNGCIPPPSCLSMRRRSKRNFNSQYCEPCPGGLHGRVKREEDRQQCMDRRKKRAADGEQYCEEEENSSSNDFTSITRMKRQAAYSPNGALDIVKVLSKLTANRAVGGGGCMEFPACVLAQKKRRKRHAERIENHQKALRRHKRAVKEHEKVLERHKRQFFAPDAAGANCAPCPAWVTLALTSRKKRDTEQSTADLDDIKYALKDIRRRQKNVLYEEDTCEQTGDCMNDSEYGEFMRKYHLGKRKKRQAFQTSLFSEKRERKCTQCHGKQSRGRAKRAFGGPTINASAGNCYAFPACRTRVKRHNFECNVCTSSVNPLKKKKRTKRNFGQVQCYPCGTGK